MQFENFIATIKWPTKRKSKPKKKKFIFFFVAFKKKQKKILFKNKTNLN